MVGHTLTAIVSCVATFACICSAELVSHTFVVEYLEGAPDGVHKEKILGINGKFPGPTIEAFVGDTIKVDVINRIQDGQNTSLHWHGIHQKKSPFDDGTYMISQCGIAVFQTQRYVFEVDQPGTYWYHSHVNSQYTEGLWGALIVHNRPEIYAYDDEILITLNDWYHRTAHENEVWHVSAPSRGVPPYPESGLMNGHGRFNCDYAKIQNRSCNATLQSRPVFTIQPNKTYRVRVINTSAYVMFNFTIDDHLLETIEVDGVDVRTPVTSEVAVIAAAQRYSFLVRTDVGGTGAERFLIRATIRHESLLLIDGVNINKFPESLMPDVTGILQYELDNPEVEPIRNELFVPVETHTYKDVVPPPTTPILEMEFLDQMLLSPYDGIPAPEYFTREIVLNAGFYEDHEDIRRGSFNETPFFLPTDKPLLMKLLDGEDMPPESFSVEIDYMDMVQVVINNPFFGPHPFHMHGHHFWVLGVGSWFDGNFDPVRHNGSLRLDGVKRDTVLVEEQSWAVIRFIADNPGVWTFHCHIDWHNLSGMSIIFVEAKELAKSRITVTEEAKRLCQQQPGNKDDDDTSSDESSGTVLTVSALNWLLISSVLVTTNFLVQLIHKGLS